MDYKDKEDTKNILAKLNDLDLVGAMYTIKLELLWLNRVSMLMFQGDSKKETLEDCGKKDYLRL
jgi:hypothetical protein